MVFDSAVIVCLFSTSAILLLGSILQDAAQCGAFLCRALYEFTVGRQGFLPITPSGTYINLRRGIEVAMVAVVAMVTVFLFLRTLQGLR